MAKHELSFESEKITADVTRDGDQFSVLVGSKKYEFRRLAPSLFLCLHDGIRSTVAAIYRTGVCYLDIDSLQLEVSEAGADTFAGGSADPHAGAKDKIFAPMPGKIVKIMVSVGDAVTLKQPMVIVEAMKMENQVNARADGTVKAIHFAAGDQVDTERPIIELELKA